MGEFGYKIKNYDAASIYAHNIGVKQYYQTKDAMLTNSLFTDFLVQNGLSVHKETSTRDIICIEFPKSHCVRTYEDELVHLKKLKTKYEKNYKKQYTEKQRNKYLEILERETENAHENKDLFKDTTLNGNDLRIMFYTEGVDIHYPVWKKVDGKPQIIDHETIHYKMLYRTPGKAKKGSCMFIREELYEAAHNFLWMGLELPYENAPIVEIGAYSSLITSTIVGKVQIKPEEILIMKDVDSSFETRVVSVETNENKECYAKKIDNYTVKNTMYDGQALIDSSIFPDWGDGYVLLRHHFCKMAAFKTHIQKFMHEYYGDDYETAEVVDMFGISHKIKDIKLITTENAIKWLKFKVTYEYWSDWVRQNDCMFGIVKTAHESKLGGGRQRMSYQMINALDLGTMDSVMQTSLDYISSLQKNQDVFDEYLMKNANYSNDYEVLVELTKHNPEFVKTDYYKTRKKKILEAYMLNLKSGKLIQNAENLVIVGSPYAMLLSSVGENPYEDPTFEQELGTIQCWTARFKDGEYLAEFRNPFNGRYNLGYLHNHYHEYFDKYFDFGELIIAVNMNGTDAQDRNNGLTMGHLSRNR